MEYVDFIKAKIAMAEPAGLTAASDVEVHPIFKPHQRDIVRWALAGGRRGRGVDLNLGYVLDGVKYLQAAEREMSMPTLFDLEDFRQAANE